MKKINSARQSRVFPYTLVEVLVVVVMALIFAAMLTVVVFSVKGCITVRDRGLKNIGTELWEGPKK